jgi:hypothetical protein
VTLFIQLTWEATEPPMRQTVSVFGAFDDELPAVLLAVLPAELEPELLQPAIASAAAATPAAAPSTADLFLSPTWWRSFCEGDHSRSNLVVTLGTETNWKLSYKIDLLPELNKGRLARSRL